MTLRKLEPCFYERVWGTRSLAPWFPQAISGSSSTHPIGEVWFRTEEIPLLVKFLFTTQNLSVQVHPGDEYARKHHNSLGKTEMWHVLAAAPGAKIAAGFRHQVTAVQARAAAVSSEIEQLLAWHDAAPGDTFFIPAGTVHAIGAGLTICEIQQLSDVTYRLYDYGRLGLDGKPRELHLGHGFAVSDLSPSAARTSLPVRNACFVTEQIAGSVPPHDSQILIVLTGEGAIGDTPTRMGEVFFASLSDSLPVRGNLQVLRTYVP